MMPGTTFNWNGILLNCLLSRTTAQLELLEPEIFREHVAGVLASGDDVARSQAWLERPSEDVRCDPRFVAHKCGFDSQMILHMVGWTPDDDEAKKPD